MNINNALRHVAECFSKRGYSLYGIGGMVRNTLLSLPISDIDVCSAMRPDELISLCKENDFNYVEKGIKYGTIEVHFYYNGERTVFEHTTFRSDSYGDGGSHRPEEVRFSNSIEEDAFRRDFTVNAIYKNLITGELTDPTGGMTDILEHKMRATTKDPSIILDDDGLRIMRLVRFACELNFDIDTDTWKCALKNRQALMDISYERIHSELDKILLSDVRYGMNFDKSPIFRGLSLLEELEAFKYIAKELEWGRSMEQKKEYHAYDVLTHAFHVSASTSPRLELRLAGLFHDVGKPIAFDLNGGKNMYGHDKIGSELTEKILKRLKYDNATVSAVSQLVLHHMYDLSGTAKESTLRRQIVKWGETFTRDFVELRIADVRGSGIRTDDDASALRILTLLEKMKGENVAFSYSELKLTGDDIIACCNGISGKRIGEIKEQLLLHCAEKPADNTREKLQKLAIGMYEQKS